MPPIDYSFTLETDRLTAPPQPDDLRYGDRANGYVCQTRTGETTTRNCRMWRTLGKDSVALIVSNHIPDISHDDLARQMQQELDYMLQVLAVRPK